MPNSNTPTLRCKDRHAAISQHWNALCAIEPQLHSLVPQADRGGDWNDWEAIKRGLHHLAGWEARRRQLRTQEAYNTAYDYLFDLFEGAA